MGESTAPGAKNEMVQYIRPCGVPCIMSPNSSGVNTHRLTTRQDSDSSGLRRCIKLVLLVGRGTTSTMTITISAQVDHQSFNLNSRLHVPGEHVLRRTIHRTSVRSATGQRKSGFLNSCSLLAAQTPRENATLMVWSSSVQWARLVVHPTPVALAAEQFSFAPSRRCLQH